MIISQAPFYIQHKFTKRQGSVCPSPQSCLEFQNLHRQVQIHWTQGCLHLSNSPPLRLIPILRYLKTSLPPWERRGGSHGHSGEKETRTHLSLRFLTDVTVLTNECRLPEWRKYLRLELGQPSSHLIKTVLSG